MSPEYNEILRAVYEAEATAYSDRACELKRGPLGAAVAHGYKEMSIYRAAFMVAYENAMAGVA